MNHKITDQILSIPPYISTTWSQIATLHIKGGVLAITLTDGETLHIPNLSSDLINLIFQYHAKYLEKEHVEQAADLSRLNDLFPANDESSIRFAFGTSFDGMGPNIIQHNPAQSNAPELPKEILQKIGAIGKILSPSQDYLLPAGEKGCNCFYCQVCRAMNPQSEVESSELLIEENEVSDEDLNFQQWTITQTGDQLYSVVHRLDEHEKFSVFLGKPIGCTCGKEGCEHILAVLKS